jgi:hypothetical protein
MSKSQLTEEELHVMQLIRVQLVNVVPKELVGFVLNSKRLLVSSFLMLDR